MRRLDGKVAIITGGSSGIGEACAERFSEEGAHVVVADIREPRRQASEESCELTYFQLDVTDEAAWLEMMSIVSGRWGRLDVLINAAGVSIDGDTVEVNLDGTFLGCKHAVRTMKLFGGGAITNIASVLGIVADGEAVAYTASKGGVRMLTKSTALYCAKSGYDIRCNAICPGYIDTPMLRAHLASRPAPEKEEALLAAAHPIGRLGRAPEIASIALYLASADASLVTGAEFIVDGGYTAI